MDAITNQEILKMRTLKLIEKILNELPQDLETTQILKREFAFTETQVDLLKDYEHEAANGTNYHDEIMMALATIEESGDDLCDYLNEWSKNPTITSNFSISLMGMKELKMISKVNQVKALMARTEEETAIYEDLREAGQIKEFDDVRFDYYGGQS